MRTHYKNGNEISLQANGCDGCSPDMINGIICHEHGCPDAWQDIEQECPWCGSLFNPTKKDSKFCDEYCAEAYNN